MFYNTLLLCGIAEKRQIKMFYEKVDDPLNHHVTIPHHAKCLQYKVSTIRTDFTCTNPVICYMYLVYFIGNHNCVFHE